MNPVFRSVFLVDDDPVVHLVLRETLQQQAFRVRSFSNGAEALAALRQDCPYFVICDWGMSPVDGLEFCQALRRMELPHYVYVALLTAKSGADNIVTGLNHGADDFITKPVTPGELLARLCSGARVLELEKRLTELARSDPLTGLMNRRTFHQVLEKEWSRAVRYRHPLSCVMIDLDHFKRINDQGGTPPATRPCGCSPGCCTPAAATPTTSAATAATSSPSSCRRPTRRGQ